MDKTDLESKYQKLATEYSKVSLYEIYRAIIIRV